MACDAARSQVADVSALKSEDRRLSLCSLETRECSDEGDSWRRLSSDSPDLSDSDGAGSSDSNGAGEGLQSTSSSLRSSLPLGYAAAEQSLLFLDWDDTLFPSTEILDRRLIPAWGDVPASLQAELRPWRLALREVLQTALATCGRVVILTNAASPWVDTCIARFAPDLLPLFSDDGVRIIYADEALRMQRAEQRARHSTGVSCLDGARSWFSAFFLEEDSLNSEWEQRQAEMTAAKRAGMEREAVQFYGSGSWENVISYGDAVYEREAVCALKGARHASDHLHECCRVKAITVPQAPSVQDLTESLWLSQHLLAAYVAFDGCLDVDQSEGCLADLFA